MSQPQSLRTDEKDLLAIFMLQPLSPQHTPKISSSPPPPRLPCLAHNAPRSRGNAVVLGFLPRQALALPPCHDKPVEVPCHPRQADCALSCNKHISVGTQVGSSPGGGRSDSGTDTGRGHQRRAEDCKVQHCNHSCSMIQCIYALRPHQHMIMTSIELSSVSTVVVRCDW